MNTYSSSQSSNKQVRLHQHFVYHTGIYQFVNFKLTKLLSIGDILKEWYYMQEHLQSGVVLTSPYGQCKEQEEHVRQHGGLHTRVS